MQQERVALPSGSSVSGLRGDRYIIEGLLGKGGSSAVYLVRDKQTRQNLFALKEIIEPNKQERDLFAFEADVLKRLNHRALPHVYQVFESENHKRAYILMDYIRGRNLEALRQEQPEKRFPLPLVLALLSPIVDALIYLHSQEPPVVHRDMKPANIIVPAKGDDAVLVDFGIAKEYIADATTTVIRHGSPGYAALEQYGSGTSPGTDIYGLGATLYTLLTGTVPVDALTRATASKGADPFKPVKELVPTLPGGVSDAIQRALSISIDDRFETIADFWQEVVRSAEVQLPDKATTTQPLAELQKEMVKSVPVPLPLPRAPFYVRKHLLLVPALLALLLIVGIGGAIFSAILNSAHPSSSSPSGNSVYALPTGTAAHPTVAPNPAIVAHPTAVPDPTANPLISTFPYPPLAHNYVGTVSDMALNRTTPLYLTNIYQNKGSIEGEFNGNGVTGYFTGTVSTSEYVRFTVPYPPGNSTLSFEGPLKLGGGSIAGSFTVLNASGQQTEYGIWSASAK